MIDKFSKDRFEAALPIHKDTGDQLWHDIGYINAEFVYGINIYKKGYKSPWVTIVIRSSVGINGFARDTGKDSIRLFFMRGNVAHGSKLSHYITRVKGWEDRMTDQLRIFYRRGMNLSTCKLCLGPKAIFKRAKGGRLFQACPVHFNVTFEKYKE